jgi:hypothetical protein
MTLVSLSSYKSWGSAAADIDAARHALEQYGSFSEPYADASEGFNDLVAVAKALLQVRMELDVLMDTFPKSSAARSDCSWAIRISGIAGVKSP